MSDITFGNQKWASVLVFCVVVSSLMPGCATDTLPDVWSAPKRASRPSVSYAEVSEGMDSDEKDEMIKRAQNVILAAMESSSGKRNGSFGRSKESCLSYEQQYVYRGSARRYSNDEWRDATFYFGSDGKATIHRPNVLENFNWLVRFYYDKSAHWRNSDFELEARSRADAQKILDAAEILGASRR